MRLPCRAPLVAHAVWAFAPHEGLVQHVQVGTVRAVLGQLLHVGIDVAPGLAGAVVAPAVDFLDFIHSPRRGSALSVVPDVNCSIRFLRHPLLQVRSWRNDRGSLNFDTLTLSIELPPVKAALEAVLVHLACDAKIGAKVGAVAVKNAGSAVETAEQHKLLPEEVQLLHLPFG